MELEKTEVYERCAYIEYSIVDLTGTVKMGRFSFLIRKGKYSILNQEQKRLDNLVTNNNGNTNDEDIEIFYASGSWHNLTP